MAYYEREIVKEGRAVNVDKQQVESDDARKTHHVFYHDDDKRIDKVRSVLGTGFEMKPVGGDVVIFLTRIEAGKLISQKLASPEK
jgi:hypothetical protein